MNTTNAYSLEQVLQLAKLHYGITGEIKPLVSYDDLNFRLKTDQGEQYVLKIANPKTAYENLELQNLLLQHLSKKPLQAQLPWVKPALNGETLIPIAHEEGEQRWMRLLHWVPGTVWADYSPHAPQLIYRLGQALGELCRELQDFHHPASQRIDFWDITQLPLSDHLVEFLNEEQQSLHQYFRKLYTQEVEPIIPSLRKSIIYNDANDYNILLQDVEGEAKIGFIDFGDAMLTHTINELAISAAYICMFKERPMDAACQLVAGFHDSFPLEESELQVLFPLIAARLLISMSSAAKGLKEHPENVYQQVSAIPSLQLLQQLREISPALAHYQFRAACGYTPCPKQDDFQEWLKTNPKLYSIVPWDLIKDQKHIFDLSVGSLELGNVPNYSDSDRFDRHLKAIMEEEKVEVAIGRYKEIRPLYTTDIFELKGNEASLWRTVHIGLDIFAKAGTPIYAPLAGKVYSVKDNAGERNYGPTLILEHQVTASFTFYTLYGHLGQEVLNELKLGMEVAAGSPIATIGPRPINGNWPPHLHFQIMLDLLDMEGDFPGVAFPHEQAAWCSICPDPNLLIGMKNKALVQEVVLPEELLDLRKQQLAPNLSVSYRRPLKMVRAFKQYLYDYQGQRYLDTVNNVPHVGHQHPRVVAAARKQQAVLNTNTRYLHDNIIQYTQQLLNCFPDELEVCFLVNSGSEANELALRLAKNWRGQRDLLVMEHGYHGNTNACVEMSGYKFDGPGGQGAADHIHKLSMPDPFRGLHRGNTEENGKRYALDAKKRIDEVLESGRRLAGFIGEPVLSCGGQVVPPPAYFKELYAAVRAAGGLCIADEVQTGFGRTGSHFWSFQQHGVVPDIVTLGKPIGNGHPLGAVICRREIAEAFANGMEYFNTFGGNPVSCAIGMEVLKIVEEERLQENALNVGEYLKKGLLGLQKDHPIIGDVRGSGLFLGFELVDDQLQPLANHASYLANRMREHGILMSTDGPDHNVLKIKPPMCFHQGNADDMLERLSKVFKENMMIPTLTKP